MKHFSTLIAIVAITVLISACGAAPAQTPTPDIAGTAQAAAYTMIAQTMAAIPTATLVPPTETPTLTPLPTNTPLALPTIAILTSPTAAPASNNSNASGDPCATRVIGKPLGHPTTIRIWNSTKTPVQVSLYLNETKDHGECGYRSYTLAKNGDVLITDLVYGCYNLWAWNTSGKPNFNSAGNGCINNPDKWTFIITTATINLSTP